MRKYSESHVTVEEQDGVFRIISRLPGTPEYSVQFDDPKFFDVAINQLIENITAGTKHKAVRAFLKLVSGN